MCVEFIFLHILQLFLDVFWVAPAEIEINATATLSTPTTNAKSWLYNLYKSHSFATLVNLKQFSELTFRYNFSKPPRVHHKYIFFQANYTRTMKSYSKKKASVKKFHIRIGSINGNHIYISMHPLKVRTKVYKSFNTMLTARISMLNDHELNGVWCNNWRCV